MEDGAVAGDGVCSGAVAFSVSPGGSYSGTEETSKFTDTVTGNAIICTSGTVKGTLKEGSGLSGTGIGTITSRSARPGDAGLAEAGQLSTFQVTHSLGAELHSPTSMFWPLPHR